MFAGFGVTLRDLPGYMKWGSHISFMRYGLEGFVGAIYGENRKTLDCDESIYCHYKLVTTIHALFSICFYLLHGIYYLLSIACRLIACFCAFHESIPDTRKSSYRKFRCKEISFGHA